MLLLSEIFSNKNNTPPPILNREEGDICEGLGGWEIVEQRGKRERFVLILADFSQKKLLAWHAKYRN